LKRLEANAKNVQTHLKIYESNVVLEKEKEKLKADEKKK
jgi:hypothetical protein